MKRVYKVSHYVTWQGESQADPFTSNVLARSAEEAITKHRRSLEKMTYDEVTGKKRTKIGVRKVALASVNESDSVDIL